MPDSLLDVEPGDLVQLKGPNAEVLPTWYVAVSLPNKVTLKVRPDGSADRDFMQVHRSRVAAVRKGEAAPVLEDQEEETQEQEEETVPDTAAAVAPPTTTSAEKPASASTASAKAVKAKPVAKAKQEKGPEPFDLAQWVKEHGGVHLAKVTQFDHKGFKVTAHVAIDEEGGFFYTINTYQYPNGSLGGKGGNKYPLKGHRLTQTLTKKGGKTESKLLKGGKTPEQIITEKEKGGYKRMDTPTKAAAVAPVAEAAPAATSVASA